MIEKVFYTCILFDVALFAMLAIMMIIYSFVLAMSDAEKLKPIDKALDQGLNIIGIIFLICLGTTSCVGFTLFVSHFLTKIWSS